MIYVISECVVSNNSQPYMVIIEDQMDDENCQYFIALKGELILESQNLPSCVFNLLAAYYVFNLEYHPKSKDILTFIQEKILKLPSAATTTIRKSPLTVSHISGLTKKYHQLYPDEVA